jgi:formate-dependent nitrite reductase membrane component NrfD
MKAIGYITVTILAIVLSTIWGGYILSILWSWFMVKAFALPVLTTGQAIGVSLVVGYFHRGLATTKTKEEDSFGETLARSAAMGFVFPLVFLAIGWVVHVCVG